MSRVRVFIVDDSVVIRQFLVTELGREPDIEIADTAVHGRNALAKLARISVDVIILDVEMPEMNGLETLRELSRRPERPPVIMFSSLTTEQARTTVEALALGAEECVAKPSNLGDSDGARAGAIRTLLHHIRTLTGTRPTGPGSPSGPVVSPAVTPSRPRSTQPVQVVAVGASTGGPNALCQLFSRLPAGFPVPIVIVQHMPAGFTKPLAERLTRESSLRVDEGVHGEELAPGRAFVAPGGRHMLVRHDGRRVLIHLNDDPPVCSVRPAVDVLFASVASVYTHGVLGVVMTGMGEDGKEGSRAIQAARGSVIVQDAASSVVWGMAGAVAKEGLADAVLPVDELGDEIVRRVHARRS